MLSSRHRFPSRGSMAVATAARPVTGNMVTLPPPEPPSGFFLGQHAPVQNLVRTAVSQLMDSWLDSYTAVRLGDTSAKPRYFGTVTKPPREIESPAPYNDPNAISAAIVSAGNAPQMQNKTAATGSPPRISHTLPRRRM